MNALDQIMIVEPPIYLPPPAKRTILSEFDTTVVSAADKGFTASSSPTSTYDILTEREANEAYLVRYFRDINLTRSDVRAVWPANITSNGKRLQGCFERAANYRAKLDKSLLFTGAKASRGHWLSRVVIGFVSLYDFEVRLHNLQCTILTARIVPPNESEKDLRCRTSALLALRRTFLGLQYEMLDAIDRAKREAIRFARDVRFCEVSGDFADPAYTTFLDNIRANFADMALWDAAEHDYEIPDIKPFYMELYGSGRKNFHNFWENIWEIEGYAASFLSEIKFVVHLPSATNSTTHKECASSMQFVFETVAHYSWTMVSSRIVEDLRLEGREVVDAKGKLIQRKFDADDYFEKIRDEINRQFAQIPLQFSHIPVRLHRVDAFVRREAKRGRPNDDDISGFKPSKARRVGA